MWAVETGGVIFFLVKVLRIQISFSLYILTVSYTLVYSANISLTTYSSHCTFISGQLIL